MFRVPVIVLMALVAVAAGGRTVETLVVDESRSPLPFPTVKVKGKRIAALGDSVGRVQLASERLAADDTLRVSYVGYEPVEILAGTVDSVIELRPSAIALEQVTVRPRKYKIRRKGKKHSGGMMKCLFDGDMAGESFGYEFHAKNDRRLLLDRVGFFYCAGDSQMMNMKFRINVYDMSEVKKAPTNRFKNVLMAPVYFDFAIAEPGDGKFTYTLPEPILLPKDAMVEIEFLENFSGRVLWFKSNLIGKNTWYRDMRDGQWWDLNPFAAPFFVECAEF